ncbi:hypothetical protein Back11_13440 [Paenibacillus baekrokdamisoli]|uniref:Uncharacterized protein n=1 Tax=Paenibacillus baekrokdamisoli TaxID=1712516 RepID=A0A3G9JAH4_9BACL|nr:DUF3243 domain-containing protein [Paenibacillus baekrokdamisoli]MBB3070649.1 hypothetical protein [Paenibacillus baekrokdamisoli]BBH19999.1 hypothetical protein Back11_13440 [Paenibacillus baekrokdamisoli]
MSEYNHVVHKDGELEPGKINQTLDRMNPAIKDEILENFDAFKGFLAKRIELAENFGLNEEQLAVVAQKVAGYLAKHEEPRNREEKLLQELWKVGNEDQQHHLSHMLVKLAQSGPLN